MVGSPIEEAKAGRTTIPMHPSNLPHCRMVHLHKCDQHTNEVRLIRTSILLILSGQQVWHPLVGSNCFHLTYGMCVSIVGFRPSRTCITSRSCQCQRMRGKTSQRLESGFVLERIPSIRDSDTQSSDLWPILRCCGRHRRCPPPHPGKATHTASRY